MYELKVTVLHISPLVQPFLSLEMVITNAYGTELCDTGPREPESRVLGSLQSSYGRHESTLPLALGFHCLSSHAVMLGYDRGLGTRLRCRNVIGAGEMCLELTGGEIALWHVIWCVAYNVHVPCIVSSVISAPLTEETRF